MKKSRRCRGKEPTGTGGPLGWLRTFRLRLSRRRAAVADGRDSTARPDEERQGGVLAFDERLSRLPGGRYDCGVDRIFLRRGVVAFVAFLAGCRNGPAPLTSSLVPPPATNPATLPVEHAGVAVYVDDELIRDYAPVPTLKTHATTITGPKFPVIDVHCHWSLAQDPDRLLAAMKKLGELRAVNLSGGWGDDLDQMLAKFHAPHPDQLLVLCNIDFARIDDPTFQADVVRYLEAARAKGVSGLKIFKSLGLTIHDKSGKIVAIDDPRLDVIWQTCGRLRMPVLIHSGDPSAFFQPIDRTNERWMQLRRHPDWSFYGKDFPTYDEVLAQHIHVIASHPQTVFISAHLANSSEDITKLAGWLRQYPNLYVDLSGRVPELGRQPYAGRKFLMKFQDRVLFGTDRYPGAPRSAARTDLLPLPRDRRRILQLFRQPFPDRRRVAHLRGLPAGRSAEKNLRRQRRPRPAWLAARPRV